MARPEVMAFLLACCQNDRVKLSQVRHFIAVAERGSLLSGAAELGVSQHVVTHSIRQLERELGTALFKRGKRSMALTPLGEMFLQRVSAAQRELDRACDEIGGTGGSTTGLVAIGMSAGPLASILPVALKAFRTRFTDTRVRIVEGDFAKLGSRVRDGILDFHVGPVTADRAVEGLMLDRLYDERRIVVGRAGHPLAGATSLAQIADAQWIAMSREEADPLHEPGGPSRLAVVVEAETALGAVTAVAASDALLVLPAGWAVRIEPFGLAVLPLSEKLDPLPIYMVTRTELPLTPAAAYLHDLIVQSSRSMAGPPAAK
ncbi:LysR family transcriptional regulator [Sphingomonas bacterium]|uniref:LysR family transcriptional regulator n=1 Tax=Sphingomonas bacterium TaxID=1895847 RepID=UPI0015770099|nr:LysR substrate-binding domain-containing protein [Sphingomonas bacterium]